MSSEGWRVHIAKCDDAIYVLHAFEKRTRHTPQADIALGRQRLSELLESRRRKPEIFMTMKMQESIDNVFKDLGFPGEEAENLKVRADLMIQISKLIRSRRLTQTRAAALFGVTQPRVSDLIRGKIERFSIDTLVAMLGHAGVQVQFTLGRKSKVA